MDAETDQPGRPTTPAAAGTPGAEEVPPEVSAAAASIPSYYARDAQSPGAGPGPGGRMVAEGVTSDQRTYAVLMHLSLLLLHVLGPLSFIVPLVMWQARRADSAFLDDHGRETVNFHLTITLYGVVSALLIPACGSGFALLAATYALGVVGGVQACRAAGRSEYYRYPMCVRFLRG